MTVTQFMRVHTLYLVTSIPYYKLVQSSDENKSHKSGQIRYRLDLNKPVYSSNNRIVNVPPFLKDLSFS